MMPQRPAKAADAAAAASWRDSAWYLLAVITAVNALNWADRQVVPILRQMIHEVDDEGGALAGDPCFDTGFAQYVLQAVLNARAERYGMELIFGEDGEALLDEPAFAVAKVGRNDPCPCGSGKKYKKCCGAG